MKTYTRPRCKTVKGNIITYARMTSDGSIKFIEVDDADRRYNIAEGVIDIDKLPPEIIESMRKLVGYWPSYVEIK